jgi:PKD repeat protein
VEDETIMKRIGLMAIAAASILLALSGCTPTAGPPRITALITAAPGEGKAPLPVRFDASRSTDPHGSLTDYLWDFGDGSPIVSGREIEHTYQRAGEYLVTLVVVGASGTGRATTFVRALNNPPQATFSYQPSDPFEGESVVFDGSASSDPDGDIARFTWDFGDGTTKDGAIVNHAFPHPGQFVVMLTVTDGAGAEAKATRVVQVEECGPGGCGRR